MIPLISFKIVIEGNSIPFYETYQLKEGQLAPLVYGANVPGKKDVVDCNIGYLICSHNQISFFPLTDDNSIEICMARGNSIHFEDVKLTVAHIEGVIKKHAKPKM